MGDLSEGEIWGSMLMRLALRESCGFMGMVGGDERGAMMDDGFIRWRVWNHGRHGDMWGWWQPMRDSLDDGGIWDCVLMTWPVAWDDLG